MLKALVREFPLSAPLYRVAGDFYWSVRSYKTRLERRRYDRWQHEELERAIMLSLAYVRELSGDIAEFGVFDGRYAKIECRLMRLYGHKRNLHLFDSWAGHGKYSEADKAAPETHTGQWPVGGSPKQVPPDDLKSELEREYSNGAIKIYQGFFADTVSRISPGSKFAFVVLDANLYSSTLTALDYIFSRRHVVPGAMFLFNGWNTSAASPEASVRRAWQETVEKYGIKYSDEGPYAILGRRMIVQSYAGVSL